MQKCKFENKSSPAIYCQTTVFAKNRKNSRYIKKEMVKKDKNRSS